MSAAGPEIRPLLAAERPAALGLLENAGLTLEGVDDPTCSLWVAVAEGRVVGVAGLERHGAAGLLRSVATDPAWRGRGVARSLCSRVVEEAKGAGVERLYLLTETAESYFRGLGFETAPRSSADPALAASEEFRSRHCMTAVLMAKDL